MSGLQGVGLLLLWGSACLGLPGLVRGALVISGDQEALQKRSTNEDMVEVYSVRLDCTVTSRFAHTVMTSKALNRANSSQEIFFEVELPKTAFIANFSMEIDGQVYVGDIKEKEKAKKQYEKAVSSGQTAGLVKASGRKMEKFSVSVNIAAESNVTFILTYEELLQRKLGRYEILTRVKPKQRVQEFQIVTNIYEPKGISYVDAHATFLSNELLPLVDKRVTDNKAHISFSPTMEEQRKCPDCEGTLIDGDFLVTYDVNRAKSQWDIQIVNGYFVHFFAPPDLPRVPKNVVFVIDRSGSMSGTKMAQTREALLAILKDIHEDDHFAIIQFDDEIDSWKESLTKATKENVDEAMKYFSRLGHIGSTNINDAVLRGVNMLVKDRQEEKLPERSIDMIILLTDGMPNSGESNIGKIQTNVHSAMGGNMSLFCLGFGNDVEYSFLDVMSKQNKGMARRIYEGSDAAVQIQGFYEEVASPLLLEVDLRYPENAVDSLTTNHYSQLFNGSEIVVAGRLTDNDLDNFMVEVFAQGFDEDFKVQGQASAEDWDVLYPDEEYIFGDFTEHLWAYLTIQQLLETSKSGTPEEKSNATAKALDMSLQYSFVTPLTSMVVTKPDTEDGPDSPFIADKLTEVDGDPHFLIELPERDDALCFNINDKPGTIFRTSWCSRTANSVNLLLTKDRSLTVTLKDSVKFVVLLHKVWAKHPYHRDYLGFYTLDSHLLSPLVHGLLGQFYHGIEYEVSELRPGEVPEKPDATMYVKGRELNVTRGWQRDFRTDVKNGENVPCWFIHSNGTGLIDGDATEYVVSGLFKTVAYGQSYILSSAKLLFSGRLVMSGLQGVGLLLLWGSACLGLPGLVRGALVISGDQEALQKRSTNEDMVEVHSVRLDCTVTSRFAHTVMTSKALNRANSSQEIFFEVDLPKTAFIANFSMASGRKMEKFSVSVNIAAESNVTFILTYEELLQRKLGRYEILTRVKPKQRVQEFQIVTNIYEPKGISYVDAHATFLSNELLPLVDKRVTDNKAHISFSPTMEEQRKCPDCEGTLIDGDFIVTYDVNRAKSQWDIQIVNGYFVHFFAPPDLPRVPKNVVFVIDRSGSMNGQKMAQTREALLAILKDIHEDDHFAIIQFDDKIDSWKESLIKATKENVDEAMKYVSGIVDNGYTNINDAVLRGVNMLVKDRQEEKLPERSIDMIILLTDGMPNAGQSNIGRIQTNVHSAMGGNMSLFCLGFGNDVEYSFLDVMSKQNKGMARRIYEGSDAAVQLQGFYEEVASPLLLEVDLRYPENAVDSLTTNHYSQLFNGSEIVVAGRLTDNDLDNFMVEVFAQGFDEDFKVQGQASAEDWDVLYPDEEYIFGDFTERLWAYLTIQQLLETSKTGTPEEKSNATAKALDMSLQYSFVTPLTSMVVTKPDTEDGPDSPLIADKLTEVDGDPHFLIELPERDDALCFNINNKPGTIFNLVRDPIPGILVNGEIIGDKMIPPDGQINTYFWRFGIVHQSLGVRLEVSTQDIVVLQDGKQVKLLWSDNASVKGTNVDLLLTKDRSLTVTLKDSVKFVILLHKVWAKHPYHRDYLGFYTLDSHLLSPVVHGLLGQFYHGIEYEVSELRPGEVPEKPDATMYVKGRELNVTRLAERLQEDVKNGENVPCWFIHSNGTGLIDGDATEYVVSGLFKTV
ncbi:Inter-alpha-trypsin inhibitor heavy chain H3 [Dissostichus eleginoides]|uniref:Inter-alpha-trypsin inhibitor heavy chain H3 n=1 Tax=Dissostichus eleginoides TaxID=100907 RepID=A0AAD9CI23_DISEL|nr:Inter-alpha-trypsin inhibitor heavy chain H3 [Dissostichus eleginoides]